MSLAKNNLSTKIILLLIGVCTILSAAAISPALPSISKHFENSELVPWILLASNYAMMCYAPFFGKIVKKLGVLRTLRIGLIWYLIFGVGAFFIPSLTLILVCRVAFALGVVAVMVTLNVLVALYFEGAERKTFIGLQGFVASLVSLGIIQASGFLSEGGWNYPFLLYGYGLIMFILSLWLPSVNKANTNNAQASEDNAKAVKIFTPAVVITLFTLLFSMMVYYVCMLYGPYLINEIGGSPAEAGTGIVILTLTGAVSALFFGKINLNSNLIYSLSFALVALGYLVLNKSMTVEWVYLGIAIAGFGIGLFLPNSTSKLMVISPKKGIPTVMSLMVVCIFGGNALGGTVAQVIRNFSNTPTTFLATAVACAFVSILYLIFRNK